MKCASVTWAAVKAKLERSAVRAKRKAEREKKRDVKKVLKNIEEEAKSK